MGTTHSSRTGSEPLALQAEDAYLVKQHVLHVLVRDVLERDSQRLSQSPLKMGHIYVETLRHAQQEADTELHQIRKQFHRRGIKIYAEERQPHGVRVKYLCRGYEHSFYMLRGLLRTEITNLMKRYLHLAEEEGAVPNQKDQT